MMKQPRRRYRIRGQGPKIKWRQNLLFEIGQLRKVFGSAQDGTMNASDYGHQVAPGRPGNFHDRAWDVADLAVLGMRKELP